LPAQEILNRLRAFTPWPGIFTSLDGKLLKIWSAKFSWDIWNKEMPLLIKPGTILSVDENAIIVACEKDYLAILELQREGGRRMSAAEFLAGHPLNVGERFAFD
jgi:methionyl-tRNA formyltransferase